MVTGTTVDTIESATNTLAGEDPTATDTCRPARRDAYLVRFDDGIHATSVLGATTGCTDVTNGFLTAAPSAPWRALSARLLVLARQCAEGSSCRVEGLS